MPQAIIAILALLILCVIMVTLGYAIGRRKERAAGAGTSEFGDTAEESW